MECKTTRANVYLYLRMVSEISTQEGTVLKVREMGFLGMNCSTLHYTTLCISSTEVDHPVAPSLTSTPISMTVDLNDKVVLSCSATGNPTPNIQWHKDGFEIMGPQAFGNEFVIAETTPKERGFYHCVAFSSFGPPARSDEVSILIKGKKVIIFQLRLKLTDSVSMYHCAGIVQFRIHIDFGSRRKRQSNANADIIETVSDLTY